MYYTEKLEQNACQSTALQSLSDLLESMTFFLINSLHLFIRECQGQLEGVSPLFLPRGSSGLNSDGWAWRQVPLSAEPSHWLPFLLSH